MFMEVDFDTSGSQPQEKVTAILLDIHFRYVYTGRRALNREIKVSTVDKDLKCAHRHMQLEGFGMVLKSEVLN